MQTERLPGRHRVRLEKSVRRSSEKKRLLGSRCRVQQVVVGGVVGVGVVIVDNIRINTSTQTLYIKTLILSREEISFQGRKNIFTLATRYFVSCHQE